MALFTWPDYVVFILMLVISLGIGVYYSWRSYRNKSTASDYLVAGRNLAFFPTTISMTVSFISALTFLGTPAETYAFGVQYWLTTIGTTLGILLAATLYVPLIYPLKLTSVNEYLEARFESETVKIIGSLTSICGMLILASLSYYGPSIATEVVTGLPTWSAIFICSSVSIIYTTLGGIRAVIWVDVFQALMMLTGMVVVAIKAILAVGDFSTVLELNGAYDRLNWITTDPHPSVRINIWGLVFGSAFTSSGIYGLGQISVQRYAALPTRKQAVTSVLLMAPGIIVLTLLGCLCGTAIFAYYAQRGCDPLMSGEIRSPNQIMMQFTSDVLNVPGVPGLFMSAIWAGSLSTVSSCLNSCAANLWGDVVKRRLPTVSDLTASRIVKAFVLLFGLLATGLAIFMNKSGIATIVEITGKFSSAMIGPSKGVVFLGGFVPWVNWIGATVGCIFSFVFGLWVSISSVYYKYPTYRPPAPTYNCTSDVNLFYSNGTTMMDHTWPTSAATTIPTDYSRPEGIYGLYSISFLWLPTVCICINIAVAIVVSILTGVTKPETLSPSLVHPWMRRYFNFKQDDNMKNEMRLQNMNGFSNSAYVESEHGNTANVDDADTKL